MLFVWKVIVLDMRAEFEYSKNKEKGNKRRYNMKTVSCKVVHAVGLNTTDELINVGICRLQGGLFGIASKKGFDMEAFSKVYFASDFAEDFESPWSHYQNMFPHEAWEVLEREIGKESVKIIKDPYTEVTSAWVGFTYAQLHIETGLSGAELARIIPFDDLECQWEHLTSIGKPSDATDILCEEYNLKKLPYETEWKVSQ